MSEMRDDLLKTVDRVSEAHCAKPVREAAEEHAWPEGLWKALEDVGLTKAALPESAGGAGLEFADAMLVLRRSAYHALPVPLAETMIAGRLLVAAGLAVPEGPLTIAPVRADDALLITNGAAGATLSGAAQRVPWGKDCAHAVVVARIEGKGAGNGAGKDVVALVATAGAVRGVEKNLAGEPRVHLHFESTPLIAFAALEDARMRATREGALCRSVQIAGALERALEHALVYANERVQFGRPIGKFQAIQHLLAVFAGQAAAASAAADAAVEAAFAVPQEFSVAVAKARCGEAAGRGAEIAHQVHGAMGYTREHNLHYSTRRLWSWRDEFGNETWWQTRLGRSVAALGADALWPTLTGA